MSTGIVATGHGCRTVAVSVCIKLHSIHSRKHSTRCLLKCIVHADLPRSVRRCTAACAAPVVSGWAPTASALCAIKRWSDTCVFMADCCWAAAAAITNTTIGITPGTGAHQCALSGQAGAGAFICACSKEQREWLRSFGAWLLVSLLLTAHDPPDAGDWPSHCTIRPMMHSAFWGVFVSACAQRASMALRWCSQLRAWAVMYHSSPRYYHVCLGVPLTHKTCR